MPECRPRQGGDDDCGGPLGQRSELGRRSGFVVVLEESHDAALVVESGAEVSTHRSRTFVEQAVVESLVVAMVEPELLELPYSNCEPLRARFVAARSVYGNSASG